MKNHYIIAAVLALFLQSPSVAHAQSGCVDLSKAIAIAQWGVHVNKYSQGDRNCMSCAQQNPNGMSGATVSGAPSTTGECCSYDCSSFSTWIVRQVPGQSGFAPAPAGPLDTYNIWGTSGPDNTGSPTGWAPCDPSKQAVCVGLTYWGSGGPGHAVTALCGKVYSAEDGITDNYVPIESGTSQTGRDGLIEWISPPGTASLTMASCSSSCSPTLSAGASSPAGAGASSPASSGDSASKMMQEMMQMQMMQQMMSSMKSSGSGASSGTGTSGAGTGTSGAGTSGTGTGTSGTGTSGTGTSGTGTAGTGTSGTGTSATGTSGTNTTGTTPPTSTTPSSGATTPAGQTPLLTSLLNTLVSKLTSLLDGLTASPTDTTTSSQSPAVQQLEQLEQQQTEQTTGGSAGSTDSNSQAVVSQPDGTTADPNLPQDDHVHERKDYRFYHASTGSNPPPAGAAPR